jgi:predicted  nucleic acid-binding Zn-ribbon protein
LTPPSIDPRVLSRLAHFDGQVHRHRAAIASGKRREADLRKLRVEVAAEAQEVKQRLEALKDKNKELQNEVDEFNVRAKRYSGRLNEIQDQREWRALNDEVRYLHRQVENREEQMLANLELIEKAESEWNAAHEEFEKRETEITNERNKILAEREMHTKKMAEAAKKLEEYLQESDKRTVSYYRRRASRQDQPVVWMEKGACSSCHALLTPQMQLEISQAKSLVTCQTCGRIIVAPANRNHTVS